MTRKISGEKVPAPPTGNAPEKRRMDGRLVVLEPLNPNRHSEALYAASHETDEARRVWTYLPDGPFDDLGSFKEWVKRIAESAKRKCALTTASSSREAASFGNDAERRGRSSSLTPHPALRAAAAPRR